MLGHLFVFVCPLTTLPTGNPRSCRPTPTTQPPQPPPTPPCHTTTQQRIVQARPGHRTARAIAAKAQGARPGRLPLAGRQNHLADARESIAEWRRRRRRTTDRLAAGVAHRQAIDNDDHRLSYNARSAASSPKNGLRNAQPTPTGYQTVVTHVCDERNAGLWWQKRATVSAAATATGATAAAAVAIAARDRHWQRDPL